MRVVAAVQYSRIYRRAQSTTVSPEPLRCAKRGHALGWHNLISRRPLATANSCYGEQDEGYKFRMCLIPRIGITTHPGR